MAETAGSEGSAITGNVPLYKRPEALEPARHGKLGLKRLEKPYSFAKDVSLMPITIGEFSQAGLDYPIIFNVGDNVPVAVMGLLANHNEFIDDNGAFERHRYVPAFIRRYPFVFAEDNANKRLVACIDVEAPMVSEEVQGEAFAPLFSGTEPTKLTRDAVEFLSSFEQQRRDTISFISRLKDLDLFDTAQVNIGRTNPDGTPAEPIFVGDYIGVSNKKLEALPEKTLYDLHRTGHLGAIFVHLHSLRNWNWLITRAGERGPVPIRQMN